MVSLQQHRSTPFFSRSCFPGMTFQTSKTLTCWYEYQFHFSLVWTEKQNIRGPMFSAFFMEKSDIVRRKSTCSSCTLWVTNCLQEFSRVCVCVCVCVSLVAQLVKNLSAMQETRFDSWVGKILSRRKWQSTPVFLPGKSHRQRSLSGYSPWGHKSQTGLTD